MGWKSSGSTHNRKGGILVASMSVPRFSSFRAAEEESKIEGASGASLSAADTWSPFQPTAGYGVGHSPKPGSLSSARLSQKRQVEKLLSSGNIQTAREVVYGAESAAVLAAIDRTGLTRTGMLAAMSPAILSSPGVQSVVCGPDASEAQEEGGSDDASASAEDAASSGTGADPVWDAISRGWK
jgi:hypothetical protein